MQLPAVCSNYPITDSLKPLLKQLHFLPIIDRIKYKLSSITHKVIYHNSFDCLVPILSRPPTTRNTITIIKYILHNTPHLNNTTQPILVLSPCPPITIRTPYLPTFVPYYLLAPSNVTLKPTTF